MSTRIVKVDGRLDFNVWNDKTTGWYVAECEALGVVAQAETWSELLKNVEEAIKLMLQDMVEDGDFQSMAKRHAWKVHGLPGASEPNDLHFDVPWYLHDRDGRSQPGA